MNKNIYKTWVTASEVAQATFCPISVQCDTESKKRTLYSTRKINNGNYHHNKINKETNKQTPCYIATYVFGNNHEITNDLRAWREVYLLKSMTGRTAVKFYYVIAPLLIKYLGKNKIINRVIKQLLIKLKKVIIQ